MNCMAQVLGSVGPSDLRGEGMVLYVPSSTLVLGAAAGVCAWASPDSSSTEEKTSSEDHLPRPHVQDCTVMPSAQRLPAHF